MGVLHTPSRHTFECDGTQRVFPIPSLMISQDFVRIEIDGVLQSDRKQWDIVNNSLVFVLAPISGAILDVQVASDSESLGELGMISNVDILAQNIINVNEVANNILYIQNTENNAIIAKEEAWRAEAERLTAKSYATEPEDVYVKIYTSNNDGTFTITNTTEYSSYHWERKATTLVTAGIIDDVTSSADKTYSSNKIDGIVNTINNNITTIVTNNITPIEDNIETIEGDVLALQGNVATLNNTTVKLTGSITGNAGTATKLSTTRANYKTITDSVVVGELMWKAYGNNHTIFDASNSTSPTGVAKNNTNPDIPWEHTYPTLMGYNGNLTYGVRVDSSRYADRLMNASGEAPCYACRAWVNFNGIGAVAIRASGNVSSITDNGVGDYTVNFTTAMPDNNYSEIVGSGVTIAPTALAAKAFCTGSRLSTAISVVIVDNNTDIVFDSEVVNVSIFR